MYLDTYQAMLPVISELFHKAQQTIGGLPEEYRPTQALLLSAGMAQFGMYELARQGDLTKLSPLLDIATRLERYGIADAVSSEAPKQ